MVRGPAEGWRSALMGPQTAPSAAAAVGALDHPSSSRAQTSPDAAQPVPHTHVITATPVNSPPPYVAV